MAHTGLSLYASNRHVIATQPGTVLCMFDLFHLLVLKRVDSDGYDVVINFCSCAWKDTHMVSPFASDK